MERLATTTAAKRAQAHIGTEIGGIHARKMQEMLQLDMLEP